MQHRAEITDGKYLREAIYGLKEPPQEETVEIIRMSEVDTQTVEWLWEPYIPFGKVSKKGKITGSPVRSCTELGFCSPRQQPGGLARSSCSSCPGASFSPSILTMGSRPLSS